MMPSSYRRCSGLKWSLTFPIHQPCLLRLLSLLVHEHAPCFPIGPLALIFTIWVSGASYLVYPVLCLLLGPGSIAGAPCKLPHFQSVSAAEHSTEKNSVQGLEFTTAMLFLGTWDSWRKQKRLLCNDMEREQFHFPQCWASRRRKSLPSFWCRD